MKLTYFLVKLLKEKSVIFVINNRTGFLNFFFAKFASEVKSFNHNLLKNNWSIEKVLNVSFEIVTIT